VVIDHQVDEEMTLRDEVSDEAMEAAAFVALGGLPTLMHHTYCFACPANLRFFRPSLPQHRLATVSATLSQRRLCRHPLNSTYIP